MGGKNTVGSRGQRWPGLGGKAMLRLPLSKH